MFPQFWRIVRIRILLQKLFHPHFDMQAASNLRGKSITKNFSSQKPLGITTLESLWHFFFRQYYRISAISAVFSYTG